MTRTKDGIGKCLLLPIVYGFQDSELNHMDGIGDGNKKVPPVPGDDSIIFGAMNHPPTQRTTFNHEATITTWGSPT